MLSTDRTEFEAQLGKLCAGLNVPMTPERVEAYWTGLSKMSLLQFVRSVDHALGENGAAKFPTVPQIWIIHRNLKSQATQITQPARQIEQQDHLLYFANRLFLRHIANRGGLGSMGRFVPAHGMIDCRSSPELIAARKAVLDLVKWFSGPIREGDADATPYEFVTQLIASLQKVSPIDPRTLTGWRAMLEHPGAKIPFAAYMGRDLTQATQLQLDAA
jgi:hypothetical protein